MIQVKWFFFEKYGPAGVSILVRESGSPTGPVIAEVSLNDEKFGELLDLVGIEQMDPDENVEPEVEQPEFPHVIAEEDEVLYAPEETEVSFPSTQPNANPDDEVDDPGDPVASEEKVKKGFFREFK